MVYLVPMSWPLDPILEPRVIIFGGAGDMGSRAVEALAETGEVSLITVADRDEDAAHALARRLDSARTRVQATALDARDHGAVVEAMSRHHVAASTLGPFYRFEVGLVSAALEAGVHYTSICDEGEPTEQVLTRFPEPLAERGLAAIIGLGASPGITNLGVRYLADTMDRLHAVDVSVFLPPDAGGGPAVMEHLCHIVTGQVPAWRGGHRVMLKACTEHGVVIFPRFGALRVWNMGHPEPFTVPRCLPGLDEVTFRMGFGPGTGLLAAAARAGALGGKSPLPGLLARLASPGKGHSSPGAVRLDARGELAGRPVRRLLCGVADMRDATGLSLAAGTLALLRGELTVSQGGVYPPEACVPPEPFFQTLASQGLTIYDHLGMRRPIW